MRKFMTFVAVLAIAACGEKKAAAPAADTTSMAAPAMAAPADSAAATTMVDSTKAAADTAKH
ncbi:MAG: hypothetical protein ACJ8AU_04850 [Gemmatimonadales bacterium]